ncbi:type II toxin-antitoxin system RelE/ParE family toxin [Thiovibrio frasassiensis]|uniref:Type II toxin-antitoxin system RelE/ParE family toxin n=1 Tax=Thiovibrio frasassiensis TaxID=2984131 RepID=A0A9X4MD04_9BACT|nr:type II toxin-antitoxin system RelE/ParE family toxin [Thiovibrio frasassiensis]MDG4475171.1 type II toxin-antitoxin system RelE/ParE family toxin [Thiovibrio frasassiensis]
MKIIWSPVAIDRASEIAQYIASDNPTAATKWVERVFAKVNTLSSLPEAGRKVPEVNRNEIRELIFGNYRIIYRIEKSNISILTIRHSKQILPVDEILA